jgi:hypothetical protein
VIRCRPFDVIEATPSARSRILKTPDAGGVCPAAELISTSSMPQINTKPRPVQSGRASNTKNTKSTANAKHATSAKKAEESAHVDDSSADSVTLDGPKALPDAKREQLRREAAAKLIDSVDDLKDATGTGEEARGAGDPRVTTRRGVLGTLLAAHEDASVDDAVAKLAKSSKQVAADIRWLKSAERRDYKPGAKNQFAWSKRNATGIEAAFAKHVAAGVKQAERFAAGKDNFLDVSNGNLMGIASLRDDDQRAAALADALCQFRARTDEASGSALRIDKVGPALVAEQRILLQQSHFDAKDASSMRNYALTREVIASHPLSSVNGVFEARNAISKMFMDGGGTAGGTKHAMAYLQHDIPPGATASPYDAIHHNFSRDTPKNIAAFVSQWMFTQGPVEERGPLFLRVVDSLRLARDGDAAGARALLDSIHDGAADTTLASLRKAVHQAKDDTHVGDAIASFLEKSAKKPLGPHAEENLKHAATVYRAVCADQPSASSLESMLFKAGPAWPQVANVIVRMREGQQEGLLKDIGQARLALRDAIFNSKHGYERHEMILLDAQLNRVMCESLGVTVDRTAKLSNDAQMSEALLGVQSALRGAVASGLHQVKDPDDEAAKKGRGLEAVLKDVDAALSKKSITHAEFRSLMQETRLEVTRTVQNIRAFVDTRAVKVATGNGGKGQGVTLDPEFLDQFVKQGPLHYATALADAGMHVGLKEEIGPRSIKNIEGMRVLNSVGPVVFPSVVCAENTHELLKLKPPRDALSLVYALEEKKMVAVGGLIVDTKNAPGGNSHLNMYAMNNGIPVLALPDLRTKYATFFKNAQKEGGVYVDDRNGEFKMMTVKLAEEQGLIKASDVKNLLPGVNRRISFLQPNAKGTGFEVAAKNENIISPDRKTRDVELYLPLPEVKGLGKNVTSFDELATLGVFARHIAGEKSTVLALLRANPKLRDHVPPGANLGIGRIERLLKDCGGIDEAWKAVFHDDPKVGVIDDDNYKESALYTDADYRASTREKLQKLTREGLTKALVKDGKLTAVGKALWNEVKDIPELKGVKNYIPRSSFTGEDRPGKSGAGQYESAPNCRTPEQVVLGIVKVLESTWMAEPVENNVSDGINLAHIQPNVTVMKCLDDVDRSGVLISRDVGDGSRGKVTYQLVKGFGGGVEGGKTEEGVITANGHTKTVDYPGEESLIPEDELAQLRELALETEKYFNDVVEKGKGHAVDMEVARSHGKWFIVQARVILMDK